MEPQQSSHLVEVFFDGDCPLCRKEITFLKKQDRHNRILFTDITGPGFIAADYDKTDEEFMDEIQGRLPDGTWITGVEVFRRLYSAIGLGPIVWLTRVPLIRQLLNVGYRVFAKNRLKLTGRCSSEACAIPSNS